MDQLPPVLTEEMFDKIEQDLVARGLNIKELNVLHPGFLRLNIRMVFAGIAYAPTYETRLDTLVHSVRRKLKHSRLMVFYFAITFFMGVLIGLLMT